MCFLKYERSLTNSVEVGVYLKGDLELYYKFYLILLEILQVNALMEVPSRKTKAARIIRHFVSILTKPLLEHIHCLYKLFLLLRFVISDKQ